MPVSGTPTTPRPLTRDDVRYFMRDLPGFVPNTGVENVLLDNVEFSDDEVERALRFTAARYNAMTPVTRLAIEQVDQYVMLVGASSHLLRSEAIRQLRNQANAQNGDGQPIGIDDKTQLYQQLAQQLSDEFEKYARGIKTQRNMEACYGGLGSGYVSASRRFNGV